LNNSIISKLGENEMQNTEIKIGQTVTAIFAWREDEQPTDANFFTGKVLEVIERTKYAIYYKIEGLQNIVPADRVRLAA
jgi:hypothetical protein